VRPAGSVLAVLTLGAVVGLASCGTGGDGTSARPSDRASAEGSTGRPTAGTDREPGAADTPTAEATRTGGALPTRPDRTGAATQAPTGGPPPATAQPPPAQPPVQPAQPPAQTAQPPAQTAQPPVQPAQPPAQTAQPPAQTAQQPPATEGLPPAQTATASAAATTPTSEPSGLGLLGWIVVIGLVAALVAGPLIWRSRRRSAWDVDLAAVETDTRTATAVRLPPVLSTRTAAQRGLAWPPLRTDLTGLVDRWDLLAERAPGEERTERSRLVQRLVQDLIEAVDAENDALANDRDWTLLRPRVNEAERALNAALARPPQDAPVGSPP
jgi:hypothetical protein